MTDTVGRGVIELVADARKFRAGVEEAKRSIRTLGEGQKDISRSASASIDQYIGKLNLQNATVGKSAREVELMRLAFRGASNEQLKAADSALSMAENLRKTSATIETVRGGLVRLAAVAGAALGAGLIASAVAFDQLVKKAANFQDIAEKIGDTGENIASFAVAASVGGIGMDALASASVRLTKNLTGVDDESKDAGAALAALGINIEKFKTLSPTGQIEEIAKSLNGFADGAEKTAVAVALFGKAGAEMIPFLKELAGETGRQNILTSEQIRLADEYADKQARLISQISLYAQAIATEFLPAVNDLAGGALDVVKALIGVDNEASGIKNNNAIRQFADDSALALAALGDAAFDVYKQFKLLAIIRDTVTGVAGAITSFDFGVIPGIFREAAADREALLTRPSLEATVQQRIAARQKSEQQAAEFVGPLPPPGGVQKPKLPFDGKRTPTAGGSARAPAVDDGRALASAQLQSDLDQIRKASEAQINAFANAEKIMQAQRAAGLLDERQYYDAKLGFIRLNAQEQERALQAEIARLQRETFTGKNADKDRLDNQRKIVDAEAKLAKVRADAVANQEINSTQLEAALTRERKAYADAQAAAQEYLSTIARQNAREIQGVGRGNRFREEQAGVSAIEDRFLQERRRLDSELRRGQIDQTKFDQYLEVARATFASEVELYRQRTDTLRALETDWVNGATEALANYLEEVRNVAKQTEDAFSSGLRGVEDLLVEMSSGGIKSFKDLKEAAKDLGQSIVADVNRILIKQNITGPLAEVIQGGLKGSGPLGVVANFFNGQRGVGTQTAAPVVERSAAAAIAAQDAFRAGGAATADAAAGTALAAQITAAGTTFSTAATTAGTTFSSAISSVATTAAGEIGGAGTTAATEISTSGFTFAGEVTAAGTTFAGEVIAAARAFAATISTGTSTSEGAGILGDIFDEFDLFSTGGQVTGPGSGTSDSIIARVSNQEFIVRASSATEPGALPFLETVNRRGVAAAIAERRGAKVIPFARGGEIIRRRQEFALADGNTGLVGETGDPEAIMPLRRSETGAPGVIVAGLPGVTLPVIRDIAGNMAVDLPASIAAKAAEPATERAQAALPDVRASIGAVAPVVAPQIVQAARAANVVEIARHARPTPAQQVAVALTASLLSGAIAAAPIEHSVNSHISNAAPVSIQNTIAQQAVRQAMRAGSSISNTTIGGATSIANHSEIGGSSITHFAAAAAPAVTVAPVLGSFERGIAYVPETGLYQLHQGERVTPAAENGTSVGGDTINISISVGPGTDRRMVDYAVDEMERKLAKRNRRMS